MTARLELVPVTRDEAQAFVAQHHRSLRAAGYKLIGECGGGSWNRRERPRVDQHPTQAKLRWERAA